MEIIIKFLGISFHSPFLFMFFILSIVFSILTTCTTFHLILNHFKYYSKPQQQRYIIRIVFMLPLYSTLTLCTVFIHKNKIYLELVRDLYESYVIYNFLALLICYSGGDSNLINHFISLEPIRICPNLIPYFSKFKYKPNENLLYYCRLSVFQYIIIKPFVTIMTIILIPFDLYGSSFLQLTKFYPYKILLQFISVGLALSSILLFLKLTFELLVNYKVILKFLSIKVILGFCFWQSIVFMILHKIPNFNTTKSNEILELVNILLITFELFIVSIVHLFAYPYDMYKVIAVNSQPLIQKVQVGSLFKNIFHTINQNDMISESLKSIKGSSKLMIKDYKGLEISCYDDNETEVHEMGEFQSHTININTHKTNDDINNSNIEIKIKDGADIIKSSGIGNNSNTYINSILINQDEKAYIPDTIFFNLLNSSNNINNNGHGEDEEDDEIIDNHNDISRNIKR